MLAGRRGEGLQGRARWAAWALKDDEFMDENVQEETLVELSQARPTRGAESAGRNTRALYNAGVGGRRRHGTIPKDTR